MTSNPFTAWGPLSPGTSRRAAVGLLAPVALAAVCLALLAPSASAAPPAGFLVGTQSGNPTETDMNRVRQADIPVFRAQITWASVEPKAPPSTNRRKHTYDWDRYDRMFESAASNEVRIVPVLLGSPSWASMDTRWLPLRGKPGYADWKRQAFYDFAKAAAKRYGSTGEFWTERRAELGIGTPGALRVRHWQIWNEPNLKNYWWNDPDTGSAAEYAQLLRSTAPALKAGDPNAVVVAAGLPWSSYATMTPPQFIEKMFAARATADIVAIHPYGKTPDSVMTGVRAARTSLNKYRPKSPIWLTEFGWASSGPDSTFKVSPATQAQYLRLTYRKLWAEPRLGVQSAMWFNLVDQTPPAKDAWYYHTGLFKRDGTEKTSWKAMKCVTGAGTCRY